jgi:hypothetical protein
MRIPETMHKSLCGRAAMLGLFALEAVTASCTGPTLLRAATGISTRSRVETANFRVVSLGPQIVRPERVEECEKVRAKLFRRWLGDETIADWSPKCEIVLHATDASYFRAVGEGGRSTVASSLVERKRNAIDKRRIDIRVKNPDWPTTCLAHELTHVVLADLFANQTLPRWLDEGIAILADPPAKQRLHRQDFKHAIAQGAEFRLLELITLTNYPSAHRWGAFYGQSASLVQYLIDHSGERRFIEFVRVALDRGCESGLQQTYRCGIPELERRWHAHLRGAVLLPAFATSQTLAVVPAE